jgi:BlaI family penicillinase repressor
MKILWKKSPLTANDIVESLSEETPWKRETIRTLVNRLVKKKALDFKKQSRQYLYFPLINESECIMEETKSFLDRVHGGSIEPMLAAFVESEKLSPEKIARLKQILDSKAALNKDGKSK